MAPYSTGYTILQPRPWLDLYGVHLKPRSLSGIQVDLAPIQQLVPDELMLIVLTKVNAYTLGKVSCVCRHWKGLAEHPKLWELACREAIQPWLKERALLTKTLQAQYRGSWKRMFLHHPHVRSDGLYVARNTYVRTGVAELRAAKTVHLVSYFRYFRFYPGGLLLYRTSPLAVSKVVRSMRLVQGAEGGLGPGEANTYMGQYVLRGSKVYCVFVYPNSRGTEVRSLLTLRSTVPGANNRMDIESIVSYDREMGTSSSLLGTGRDLDPDAEPDPGAERKDYRRGLAPCVFVPFDQVHTSVLNLPPTQMDYYMPG